MHAWIRSDDGRDEDIPGNVGMESLIISAQEVAF